MSRRDFFLGFLFACVLIIGANAIMEPEGPSLQDEYDSYHLCMQSAHVCRMTFEDYVRYHEVKRMLDGPVPQ
jgi:hypothetical protein